MPKITKQDAQRFLGNVAEEHVFRCCDGCSIRNLKELQVTLADMADDVFAYHSNPDKSDFSNWVRDIIGDEKLADDLSKAKNRSQALAAVARRVAFLEGRI